MCCGHCAPEFRYPGTSSLDLFRMQIASVSDIWMASSAHKLQCHLIRLACTMGRRLALGLLMYYLRLVTSSET